MKKGSIGYIFEAMRARYVDTTKDKKLFASRQTSLFNEGILQFKLREQLQEIINEISDNPKIKSIRVTIIPDAIPFVDFVLKTLNCSYEICPEPGELLINRQVTYL